MKNCLLDVAAGLAFIGIVIGVFFALIAIEVEAERFINTVSIQ